MFRLGFEWVCPSPARVEASVLAALKYMSSIVTEGDPTTRTVFLPFPFFLPSVSSSPSDPILADKFTANGGKPSGLT